VLQLSLWWCGYQANRLNMQNRIRPHAHRTGVPNVSAWSNIEVACQHLQSKRNSWPRPLAMAPSLLKSDAALWTKLLLSYETCWDSADPTNQVLMIGAEAAAYTGNHVVSMLQNSVSLSC